jgi:hypothetical protein
MPALQSVWFIVTVLCVSLGRATTSAQTPRRASSILRLDGTRLTASHVDSVVTRLMEAAQVQGLGIALIHDGVVTDLLTGT